MRTEHCVDELAGGHDGERDRQRELEAPRAQLRVRVDARQPESRALQVRARERVRRALLSGGARAARVFVRLSRGRRGGGGAHEVNTAARPFQRVVDHHANRFQACVQCFRVRYREG